MNEYDEPSIIERTDSRGEVTVKFPWVGGHVDLSFPATNRSVMVIAVAMMVAFTIVVPTCFYITLVQAEVENIDRVDQFINRKPAMTPEKAPDKLTQVSNR